MENLIISFSGIRGIVGKNLTPEIGVKFGTAFGNFVNSKKIVIGTDTRPSKEIFKQAVVAGLLATGKEVIDLGICPTPTCQLMIKELNAGGAIVITASHNPSQWNGIKWYLKETENFTSSKLEKLINLFMMEKFKYVSSRNTGCKKKYVDAYSLHLSRIIKHLNLPLIRKRRFKVVLDSCNGAGSVITPLLLEQLNCKVVKLYCDSSGIFLRNPEPLPSNLKNLVNLVKETKADIGFAQDADADRLAIVSEKGIPISEENTLALVVKFILKRRKGKIVVNLSTTSAIEDIAYEYKNPVIYTQIGENNVIEKMKEIKAIFGGEGNGGIIDPEIHYCRDSLIGMAYILQYLAEEKQPISLLNQKLPKYYMIKRKISCFKEKIPLILEKLYEKYKKEKPNTSDGIKTNFKSSWVHVRPSNTESVLRVICEAKTLKEAKNLYHQIYNFIKEN